MNRIPLGRRECLIALVICLGTAALIGYKVYALGYTVTTVSPEDGYYVRLLMDVTGDGGDVNVRLALPINSDRQQIVKEEQSSDVFRYTISPGRQGRWFASKLVGNHGITYSFRARTHGMNYAMPVGQDIPTTVPERLWNYLKSDDKIQATDAEITSLALRLAPAGTRQGEAIKEIYNYCHEAIRYIEVRGPTDAVTTLRLREASCNGKSRLMVALLRAKGIPARIASGLLLERVRKRTTHAWVEAWTGDHWVPFCPTNGHYAEIPANYLELSKDDVPVITRSSGIGFDWRWDVRLQTNMREQAVLSNADHPLNLLRYWTQLKEQHISLDLIMVILMIPIAASVVAFFRNIVGLVPFGTFMPALIAVAFRDTGLMFGAVMFFLVMLVCMLANLALMRLRLLHIPRLVCIITLVVMSIVSLSVAALQFGITRGAAVSLFPMAILSLTTERFTMTMQIDGWKAALQRAGSTFIVAAGCFLVINLELLQLLIVAFPELLFLNIAFNLLIGSWTGLRLVEFRRFHQLTPAEGA